MTTETLKSAQFVFLRLIADVLRAVALAVARVRGAQARYERLQRLQTLSDAELARRGLAREDLVRHVFANVFAD